MAHKKQVRAKANTKSNLKFLQEVAQCEEMLVTGQQKLLKAYKKAKALGQKQLEQGKKKANKAKVQIKSLHSKLKGKGESKTLTKQLTSSETKLTQLEAENIQVKHALQQLVAKQQKFIAAQKMVQTLEKEWSQKLAGDTTKARGQTAVLVPESQPEPAKAQRLKAKSNSKPVAQPKRKQTVETDPAVARASAMPSKRGRKPIKQEQPTPPTAQGSRSRLGMNGKKALKSLKKQQQGMPQPEAPANLDEAPASSEEVSA